MIFLLRMKGKAVFCYFYDTFNSTLVQCHVLLAFSLPLEMVLLLMQLLALKATPFRILALLITLTMYYIMYILNTLYKK